MEHFDYITKLRLYEVNDHILGRNIYYLRNKKRISREKFSEMVGMSNNILYCLEKGLLGVIPIDSLEYISKMYHVSVEELVGED